MVRKLFWWGGMPAVAVSALLMTPVASWARGHGYGGVSVGAGGYRGFSGGFYGGSGYRGWDHDGYRGWGGYGYRHDYDYYRPRYYSYYPGYSYPGYSTWGYNYSTPDYDYSYTGTVPGYQSSYYSPQVNQQAVDNDDQDRVTFNVRVPDDAEVWFEGARTTQTGTRREFVSPPLEPGRTYTYDIRVRYPEANGRTYDRNEHVRVHAGDRLNLDFTRPEMRTSESTRPGPDQADEQLTNPPRERSNQALPRTDRTDETAPRIDRSNRNAPDRERFDQSAPDAGRVNPAAPSNNRPNAPRSRTPVP